MSKLSGTSSSCEAVGLELAPQQVAAANSESAVDCPDLIQSKT
jgi:hypothetical protein